jgi:hypothetical protein
MITTPASVGFHNMTSKAARHIELRKNAVREWVQDKTLKVQHVSGKINPADIFTKEMQDGTHFHQLWDSFMSLLLDFISGSILAVHHASQQCPHNKVAPAAAVGSTSGGVSGYFTALTTSSFFRSLTNISHLSSAGRYLLRRAHAIVLPDIF